MGSPSQSITMVTTRLLLASGLLTLALSDFVGHNHGGGGGQLARGGRQDETIQGGIDFSGCQEDAETGLCCVEKEETVVSLEKEPLLQCTHKNVEQCHYTYITEFKPTQEEVCQENFQKQCQITFKQQAFNETVRKCYKPIEKVCNGQGEEECKTIYESSCTTKYVEKQPGKFVGDSSCEKLPVEICGAGCTFEEGPEECHDKVVASVVEIPEEVCDLNPQKTCRYTTKLVPRLSPKHECTIVPKETCHLSFSSPTPGKKPLLTKWCLDESELVPEVETNGVETPVNSGDVLGAATDNNNDVAAQYDTYDNDDDYDYGFPGLDQVDNVPDYTAPQSFYGVDTLEEPEAVAVDTFYGAPRDARRAQPRRNNNRNRFSHGQ